ncbi:hypothetical protein, partial [Adlercreutzia sp. DFI.6.23]|uniref:hypothetical protein n=1 Tax=Adlercreutzia sp. DFI.6.23 TaxID=2963705 RepID=UPI00210EB588
RLVADVAELDGLAKQPLLDLGGPVGVQGVVADRGEDVFCLGACAPLAACRLLDLLLLFLEPCGSDMRAAHGRAALGPNGIPLRALRLFSVLTKPEH